MDDCGINREREKKDFRNINLSYRIIDAQEHKKTEKESEIKTDSFQFFIAYHTHSLIPSVSTYVQVCQFSICKRPLISQAQIDYK